jgi:hypothetical protein
MNNQQTEDKSKKTAHIDKKGSEGLENEFKVTVRKLEMPVRPRGVLAE